MTPDFPDRDDPMGPARGIFNGVLLGLAAWALILFGGLAVRWLIS